MKTELFEKHKTAHSKCVDVLAAILQTEAKLTEKIADFDEWKRLNRQRLILVNEYNKTLKDLQPIEIPADQAAEMVPRFDDSMAMETIFKTLSPRTANGLREYFTHLVPVEKPGLKDLQNMDFDLFESIRRIGIGSRIELQRLVQNL